MNIEYSKTAKKAFYSYGKKIASRLERCINQIPSGDIKKLEGRKTPPLYRLRVGNYRIIYTPTAEGILVVKIDTRGDVYKTSF